MSESVNAKEEKNEERKSQVEETFDDRSKKRLAEEMSQLEKDTELDKKPELEKQLLEENKSKFEEKLALDPGSNQIPSLEKDQALEKKPISENNLVVEKKPVLEIQTSLDKNIAQEKKVDLEESKKIVTLEKDQAFENKPITENNLVEEKKPVFEKKTPIEQNQAQGKKLQLEENSNREKKPQLEIKPEVGKEIIARPTEKVEVKDNLNVIEVNEKLRKGEQDLNAKQKGKPQIEGKSKDSKTNAKVQDTAQFENKAEDRIEKLNLYEEQSDISAEKLLSNTENELKDENTIQNGGNNRRPRGIRHAFIRVFQRIRRAVCSLFRCRPDDRSSHGSINELVTILPPPCPTRRFLPEIEQMPERGRVTGRFMTVNRRRKKPQYHLAGDIALSDDFVLGHVKKYLSATVQWEFNAFALENVTEGKCLAVLCVHLFHSYGLMQHFNMDAERVWKLFSLIEEGYHSSNPYHNAIHAADVTQAMHCFLQETKIREHMEPIELMSALLAAIAHDLDHPGVSQPFLIATNNYLARLYDNTSVLENHHWRTAVSCVLESRVLINVMSDDVCTTLVSQVSSLILATDITRQQDYLSQFKNHLDSKSLDMRLASHRHMVLQIALKCADISNPCRPWEISKKWSLKVCEEFFRQGDYEQELKLPVTALCDRYSNSIPSIQTGFFKFVVLPLMTEWHRFLQSDLSKEMMKHLHFNEKMWEKLMEDEVKAEENAQNTAPKPQPPENKMKPVEEVEEEDESGSVSDSNERLLPLRRRSLTTKKCLKKQIRRFSVPLNLFEAYKKDKRDAKAAEPEKVNETPDLSKIDTKSLALAFREVCQPGKSESDEIVQAGQLRPDCKITCMTSPELASRLHAIKTGKHKIVRQLTFPPLEAPAPRASLFSSAESGVCRSEVPVLNKMAKEISVVENTIFGMMNVAKTEEAKAEEASEEKDFLRKFWLASGCVGRRESAPIGSQLRDNLTAVKLEGIGSDPQLQRRKSMPTHTDATLLKTDPRESQVASALPDLLRTLSGKDTLTRRRGSAPVPVASEASRRGSARRPQASCKAACPEAYHAHRRSSLPVEAFRPTEVKDKEAIETPPATQ